MKKKVAIVTYYAKSALFYRQQLKELFLDHIEVSVYSFDNKSITNIQADLILVSTYSMYEVVKKYVKDYSKIIIVSITLTKKGLEKVLEIPKGTTAMLVNSSGEMAVETISLIYQSGVKHIELIPVYPGLEEVTNIDFAITPGEVNSVPSFVSKIIDIGHRVLDLSTIVDIAVKLDLDYLLQDRHIQNYFDSIVTNNYGIESLLGKTNRLECQFNLLAGILEDGIIGVNSKGIIYFCNQSAENIMALKKEHILWKDASIIIPKFPFNKVIKTSKILSGELIKIHNKYIVVSIYPIFNNNDVQGAIALIKKFSDTEKQQHKLRSKIIGKGHVAKYNFHHIISDNIAIKNIKETAKKMAKSDSSILIYGESGTGKELFAQAIHNNSRRKNYQFIAVNCAAIPDNLLESELFGYEEGAFTGAKKGGKLGFFELAHMGTLFLDEISEMAPKLQARLLRVLQEKEVTRIGGDRVINVDVRIIAATNKKLKELVMNGEFRNDLYYRLNVLPLNIIPLRNRREDIPLLIKYFQEKLNVSFRISPQAMIALEKYDWQGNVRELRNCVEYLTYLDKEVIEIEDISYLFQDQNNYLVIDDTERDMLDSFIQVSGNKTSKYIFVLKQLEKAYINRKILGRRSIASIAVLEGISLSEQEIRKILIDLEKVDMVEVSIGRRGSRITDFGLKTIKIIKMGKMGL